MNASQKFLKENGGYILALTLVGAFLYAFNLHGPLFWDDADWIVNNAYLHALNWVNIRFIFSHDVLAGIGQVSNYYRPFLFLTFLANYLVSGTSPVSYHIVSNVIHIGNAVLVFYLLLRWFDSRRLAFLASLLFLIHPLQTEAVAYVSGRGDPLSILFTLSGISLFLYFRDQQKNLLAYIWASVAMILAVLSRETAALFPIYLGVTLMAFEERGVIWLRFKKAFVTILPFAGISMVYGLLRLTVLNFQDTLNFYQQQNVYSQHLIYRIYTFLHALVVYIRLILLPIGLHMDRDIPVSTHLWNAWAWLGAAMILGLFGWLMILYRQKNKTQFNVWFFGMGIFFVNLLPTSGIVPINARIYEHWLYFSLFGFFTILAFYIDWLWAWLEKHKRKAIPVLVIPLVAYCLFLGIQTIRRNLVWSDTEQLYLNILYYEPSDVRILNNLGNWYSDHENNTDAAIMYQRAVDADPTQPAPYYNLGNIARDTGQLDKAETFYKKAIEVSPTFHYAYGNLASLYVAEKKYPEALAELQQLEKMYPTAETEQNIELLRNAIGE